VFFCHNITPKSPEGGIDNCKKFQILIHNSNYTIKVPRGTMNMCNQIFTIQEWNQTARPVSFAPSTYRHRHYEKG
jgi:hypothetical protein